VRLVLCRHFTSNLKVQHNQPQTTTVCQDKPGRTPTQSCHRPLVEIEIEIHDFIPEVKNVKLVQVNCVNKEYFVAIYKRDVILICFEFLFCLLIWRPQAKDEIYLYSKMDV
jgi:hypothetical protein